MKKTYVAKVLKEKGLSLIPNTYASNKSGIMFKCMIILDVFLKDLLTATECWN